MAVRIPLQAALLRTHTLSGVNLCSSAEHDPALVDGGDPAAATGLRQLLAFLAARDGRAADALRLYEEAIRGAPFDLRPRVLVYHLRLAATGAGAMHAVLMRTPPWEHSPFVPSVRTMLLESAQGLQAALLGAHLRDVRARAEHDVARLDGALAEGGDPAAATDLRLLLALLAARDGRAADALRLYEEAARDAPFDPRPRALAHHLCLADGRHDESVHWSVAYHRLVPEIGGASLVPLGLENDETRQLVRELLVAATVGGVCDLGHPADRSVVMRVGCGAVDQGLLAALQDESLSAAARIRLRALRVYLHAKVRLLIDKEAQDMANGGAEPSPISWEYPEMLSNKVTFLRTICPMKEAMITGPISTVAFRRSRSVEVPGTRRNFSTWHRQSVSKMGDESCDYGNKRDSSTVFDMIGPVHNIVTWCLNGPDYKVQDSFDNCTGHQRLFHCIYGQAQDASSLFGEQKLIYTTAIVGTFYLNVRYSEYDPSACRIKDYAVRLIVDAREGWDYGFMNKYGFFEYYHTYAPYIIHRDCKILDFEGDYSTDGIAPLGLGSTLMGLPAARQACKLMSEYDGRSPITPQLRMACAIMVNYGCESWKLHNVHESNSETLLNGMVCTMDEWNPNLPFTMRNWSKISNGVVHFVLHSLHSPGETVLPKLPNLEGIHTIDDACETVAIVPYNRVPRSAKDDNSRRWNWLPVDEGAEVEDGKPHYLSKEFLRKWPFHDAVANLRPPERVIDLKIAGPLAKKVIRPSTSPIVKQYPRPPKVRPLVQSALRKTSKHALDILRWLKR